MNWIQQKEKENKKQICNDFKRLENSKFIIFTDDFGTHKALIIESKKQVPSFGLFPIVHNRSEYDIFRVRTPQESESNEKFFFYAIKNNTSINERFEVVR